jgi:hypothetical protein
MDVSGERRFAAGGEEVGGIAFHNTPNKSGTGARVTSKSSSGLSTNLIQSSPDLTGKDFSFFWKKVRRRAFI